MSLNTSRWLAPSSKTLVKANFSTARFLLSLKGGRMVMWVGKLSTDSSTSKNRSLFGVVEGRNRRYTSNRAVDGRGGGSIAIRG
jgi:hypothetical protein